MRNLIIGASGGIGTALVHRLSRAGEAVTGLSRREHGLDITDETAVARVLGDLTDAAFDRVFITTGGLEIDGHGPEKSVQALEPAAMAAQFALNAIGPALVLKHLMARMPRGQVCRIGVLSARVGSIGDNRLGGWHSYRAAKAALNQLVHGAAIELARRHPSSVLVCLHPGTVATPLTAAYAGQHPTVAPDVAAGNLIAVLDGLTPAQSGGFYDWRGQEIPW